jgi:hypothetical protein
MRDKTKGLMVVVATVITVASAFFAGRAMGYMEAEGQTAKAIAGWKACQSEQTALDLLHCPEGQAQTITCEPDWYHQAGATK